MPYPDFMPPMNVPVAPVDQNFSVPTMGQQMPMQGMQQQSDQFQHFSDVIRQYDQNRADQKSTGGLTEAILSQRFAPQMQDVGRSISQTTQAYGAPDLFKAATPYDTANERAMNELAPYTTMAELQSKMASGTMNQAGGATGVLANRIMQEANAKGQPMSFTQALQMAQTGFRQNTMMDANGNIVVMPGALSAIQDKSNAQQTGQNVSDLSYKPQIAGGEAAARTGIELSNAAGIEQQKKIGAGEITPVQNLTKGRGQVTQMIQNIGTAYDRLNQAGGAVNPNNPALYNLGARAANSGLGQMMGQAFGTQNQSIRNQIEQARPLLINAIRQATGMSAKAMDSNAELQFYLKAATDPTLDVKSNMVALQNLERLYGLSSANMSGSIPTPPTPDQINQQMPPSQTFDIDSYLKEKGLQ